MSDTQEELKQVGCQITLQLEAKVQKAKVGKSCPLHCYCNTRGVENNVNTHQKETNDKNYPISKQLNIHNTVNRVRQL